MTASRPGANEIPAVAIALHFARKPPAPRIPHGVAAFVPDGLGRTYVACPGCRRLLTAAEYLIPDCVAAVAA